MEALQIGSATEWDRLIAEGKVEGNLGFIVSDEREGDFQVSFFLLPRDEDDFAFSRNQAFRTVRLSTLLDALEHARERLCTL
jgi:hypothetical protein